MEYLNFEAVGTSKNKKQILIHHTNRPIDKYLLGLETRYSGKYNKIPHYVIDVNGKIYNTIDPTKYTNIFDKLTNNKRIIFISLENLGWLKRNVEDKNHINWIGDIYSETVYIKKWREYIYWQPYKQKQMIALKALISNLCNAFDIPKVCTGTNVKFSNVEEFNGVSFLSNYDTRFTEVNPSFDFNNFIKKVEDEQYI